MFFLEALIPSTTPPPKKKKMHIISHLTKSPSLAVFLLSGVASPPPPPSAAEADPSVLEAVEGEEVAENSPPSQPPSCLVTPFDGWSPAGFCEQSRFYVLDHMQNKFNFPFTSPSALPFPEAAAEAAAEAFFFFALTLSVLSPSSRKRRFFSSGQVR